MQKEGKIKLFGASSQKKKVSKEVGEWVRGEKSRKKKETSGDTRRSTGPISLWETQRGQPRTATQKKRAQMSRGLTRGREKRKPGPRQTLAGKRGKAPPTEGAEKKTTNVFD